MNYEFIDLLYIRVKAFAVEAGVLLAVAFIGVLNSPEFAALVSEHFGSAWGAIVLSLVVNGVIKHLMNIKAIKDYKNRVGGSANGEPPILI